MARAGAEVSVIRVRSDKTVTDFEIERRTVDGVDEILAYYPIAKIPVLKQISIAVNFIRSFAATYRMATERHGRPDICQVNILTRMGAVAWWLKKRAGIPYAVIEHWGRYMPNRNGYKGFWRRRITEAVCKEAGVVMPVSNELAKAMQNCGIKARHWVANPQRCQQQLFHSKRHRAEGRHFPLAMRHHDRRKAKEHGGHNQSTEHIVTQEA